MPNFDPLTVALTPSKSPQKADIFVESSGPADLSACFPMVRVLGDPISGRGRLTR